MIFESRGNDEWVSCSRVSIIHVDGRDHEYHSLIHYKLRISMAVTSKKGSFCHQDEELVIGSPANILVAVNLLEYNTKTNPGPHALSNV